LGEPEVRRGHGLQDPQFEPSQAAEIPRPPHARVTRHGVLKIVLLGACAVLTRARSFEYTHDTGRAVLDTLGVGWCRTPRPSAGSST